MSSTQGVSQTVKAERLGFNPSIINRFAVIGQTLPVELVFPVQFQLDLVKLIHRVMVHESVGVGFDVEEASVHLPVMIRTQTYRILGAILLLLKTTMGLT